MRGVWCAGGCVSARDVTVGIIHFSVMLGCIPMYASGHCLLNLSLLGVACGHFHSSMASDRGNAFFIHYSAMRSAAFKCTKAFKNMSQFVQGVHSKLHGQMLLQRPC